MLTFHILNGAFDNIGGYEAALIMKATTERITGDPVRYEGEITVLITKCDMVESSRDNRLTALIVVMKDGYQMEQLDADVYIRNNNKTSWRVVFTTIEN